MMSLASVIIRNPGADFRISLPVSSLCLRICLVMVSSLQPDYYLQVRHWVCTLRQRFSPQREAELLTQFVHRVAEVMGSSSVTPK